MTKKSSKIQKLQMDRLYVVSASSFFVILISLYVYFVSASVLHAVLQQEVEQEISFINTEISKLESEYIDAQFMVSDEIATRRGYVPTHKKVFIDRTDNTLVLSTRVDN